MKVRLDQIKNNPYNTREDYGDLSGLKVSIKKFGLTQPLLTRKTERGYELAFGGRRYEALRQIGQEEVDIEVRNISQKDMAILSLCENVHRKNLNAVEQAKAYNSGLVTTKLPLEEFARTIGVATQTIREYLGILGLPQNILRRANKYKNFQLIGLGKLQNKSKSLRIMLENLLENKSISVQFLRQIVSSCESIYSSNLSMKVKKQLCGEVIFHDYSLLPPENYHDIRTFSNSILGKAITKHQKGLIKTETARKKLAKTKVRKRPIRKVTDIVHIDQKLDDITSSLREANSSIQKTIRNNYYGEASKRSQRKFRTVVNHLVSGLEKILK